MKTTLSVFFSLFMFFLSTRASNQTDSLLSLYNNRAGIEKIQTGLLVAEKLDDDPELLLSFSLDLFDETGRICPKTFLQAKVARAVGDAFFYNDSFMRSNEYLIQAVTIAEKLDTHDTLFLGNICNDIGMNFMEMRNNHQARYYMTRSISFLEGSHYQTELADSKSNLALLFHSEGNYEDAIRLLQEVYQTDLKTGDERKISSSLNNLGRIYIDWGKFTTGLDYYLQSLNLLDSVSDSRTLGLRYNNIGMAYQKMGNHREAIHWIEMAKKIDEKEGPSVRLAIRYVNLGNSYFALSDFTKAEFYLKKSVDFFKQTQLYSQTSKALVSLGQLYLRMGLTKKASAILLDAMNLAEKGGQLPEKSICYEQLYQYYKSEGNFPEALHYYELHSAAEDSIYSIKVSEQVEAMEAQYQNKQKEAEIIRLEKENNLKIKEIEFKNKQRNLALTGASILIIVLIALVFLFNTVRTQKNKLENQNKELDRLNKTLNRLFAIISHDLRNATAAYQSSAKIIDYHLGKGQPEKLLPLSGEISINAKNLSSMLENLLQWSTLQLKGVDVQKVLLNVKTEIEKTTNLLNKIAEDKGNEIKVDIGNDVMVWCDRESFNLIIRNLLGNALKFTSNGCISFDSEIENDFTIIKISDTGCGIPDYLIKKLFKIGSKKIRMGSSGEKGTGLGLLMVAEHVSKNNGTIKVESQEGKGTRFIVSLPSK